MTSVREGEVSDLFPKFAAFMFCLCVFAVGLYLKWKERTK